MGLPVTVMRKLEKQAKTGLPMPGLDQPYYAPMKAKEGTPERVAERFVSEEWFAEEKFDGARYLCYVTPTGNRFFSRRISVKDGLPVEKTLNVPHLAGIDLSAYMGSILDGEIATPLGGSSEVIKILGALPPKAVQRQLESGKLQYKVFDILVHNGASVMDTPLVDRLEILKNIPETQYMRQIKRIYGESDKRKLYKDILAEGGEGIILKYIKGKYIPGGRNKDIWMKVKRKRDYDVVVTGYESPSQYSINVKGEKVLNKHWQKGWIATVRFGAYKEGKLVEVGRCSGFDEATRADITANQTEYKGGVIVIEGYGFLEKGIRHPTFIRFRDDKSPRECLWEDIIEEKDK